MFASREKYILLIGLVLVLASVITPQLRQIIKPAPRPSLEKLERLVAAHSHDWQLWQALAEHRGIVGTEISYRPGTRTIRNRETIQENGIRDYCRAISLNPISAQLHCNFGLIYLSRVRYIRKEESMFTGETNIEEKFDFDRTDVEMASQAIHRAIELEPDNTFYNYLLAHLLFGRKKDDEALRSLWKATRKSYCSMHCREGVSARIRLLEVAGLPGLEVRAETLPTMLHPHLSLLRHIARLATSLGVEYQKKGEHDRAIDVYQSVFEMGRKIREGAWLIIDELVGITIESIPAHNFSPGEEELAGIKDWEEKRERKLKLTNERFRKYLIEHGRWEFAKRFQKEMVSGQAYVERASAYTGEFQTKGFLWALGAWGLTMLSCYCFHQSILYLILFTILLLLWPYFNWRAPIKWNYKRISIFTFVAVFISLFLAVLLFWFSLISFRSRFPYLILLTPVLVAIFAFTYVSSKLKKAGEDIRPQIVSSSMNCLRITLPRILAVFLLFYVLLIIPTLTIRGKLEKHLNRVFESETDLVREYKKPISQVRF